MEHFLWAVVLILLLGRTLGLITKRLGAHNMMDEVLPVIVAFVNESLGESSFGSIDEVMRRPPRRNKNRTVLEITPPGAPCPHCNGLLSEDTLHKLLMKLYMRYRSRGDRHER